MASVVRSSSSRCPETTPVNEVVETAFALEDEVGVQLGPVVVNGVDVGRPLPDDDAVRRAVADLDEPTALALVEAAAFRRSRRAMEAGEIARLAAELPIPKVTLSARSVAGLTSVDIEELARALRGVTGVEP